MPTATSTSAAASRCVTARPQGPGAGRRRPRPGRSAPPAAPLARRRRAAGPLSRAEHAAADPRQARGLHAGRDQRGAADSAGVGRPAPAADLRVDRRAAARARRAAQAGDLRPHPQAHRRASDHRALHRHAPAGAAAGLPRRVRALLVGQPGHADDLDQPLHAASRRAVGGVPDRRRSPRRDRHPARDAPPLSEAADAGRADRRARRAAGVARRMHLRPDDRVLLRGFRDSASRRASSAARPTARSAGAWRRRASPRWAGIA